MLKRKFITGLPVLALGVAMAAASGSAFAGYAVSTTTITNFDINGLGMLPGFTLSADFAVEAGFGVDADISTTNAAPACVGTACAGYNDQFFAHGMSGDYAYGDAQIVSVDVLNGNGAASSIAEVSASGTDGMASGGNTLSGFFSLVSASTLSFSFDATSTLSLTGLGSASSAMSISIYDAGANLVYNWTPTGLTQSVAPGSPFSAIGSFSDTTGSLAAGTYTMSIAMSNLAVAQAVPEADTWAMMAAGLGLVALGVRRRRLSQR